MKKLFLRRYNLVVMGILSLSLFSVAYTAYGLYLEATAAGWGLNQCLGVDFLVLYLDMVRFIKTSVLYNSSFNRFFNTPFMSFLCLPYAFLPLLPAKIIKLIIIIVIYVISIRLLCHHSYRSKLPYKDIILPILCFTVTFFVSQLYLLNVYVEVMFCLLLSVFFYKNSKFVLCAFFLSLAVTFKIFLIPLMVAPLIARKYKLFLYSTAFALLFLVSSLLIFGIKTHFDMIDAILIDYANRKINLLEASDRAAYIYSGLSDFPLKLYVKRIIPASHLNLYGAVIGVIYTILSLILCLRIIIVTHKYKEKEYYLKIFATLLLIILVFVFRYDFGTLLFPLLPVLMEMKKIGKYTIYAILLLGVHYLFIYDFFKYVDMSFLSLLIYLFSPSMLIGIGLVFLMYYYWFSEAALE